MQPWMSPMLCESTDEVPTGDEWALEPKLDGWRCVAFRGEGVHTPSSPSVRIYGGRNGSEYNGKLPYLESELFARLPRGTCVDGELMSTVDFGNVGSIMRSSGEHVPSDARPALVYVIFDITRVDDQDVRSWAWHRRQALLDAVHFDGAEFLRRSIVVPSTQTMHDAMLRAGAEGSVAKRRDRPYTNGRSRNWLKIKPQHTCEAIVTGFDPGKGSLAGMVGAFQIKLVANDATTTVKCGETATHRDATVRPERWLGQMIEIKHHGIQKSGKPRHPQFLRRRDDR